MKWKRILKCSALAILFILFAWFEIAYWTSTNDCGRTIPTGAERMKAIRFCEYGPPDVLHIEEIEKPLPTDDDLLVKVRASSLNFIDNGIVRGPWVLRFMTGLRKPSLPASVWILRALWKRSARMLLSSNQAMKSLAGNSGQSRSMYAFARNASL